MGMTGFTLFFGWLLSQTGQMSYGPSAQVVMEIFCIVEKGHGMKTEPSAVLDRRSRAALE